MQKLFGHNAVRFSPHAACLRYGPNDSLAGPKRFLLRQSQFLLFINLFLLRQSQFLLLINLFLLRQSQFLLFINLFCCVKAAFCCVKANFCSLLTSFCCVKALLLLIYFCTKNPLNAAPINKLYSIFTCLNNLR